MDQQKVNIVCLQLPEGLVNGSFCFFIAIIGNPYLCGEKQFLTGNITFFHGISHCFLVSIRLRGINGTIPDRNCICHTALTLFAGHLIYTIA